MVNEIILNDTTIQVTAYQEEVAQGTGAPKISFDFKVKTNEYHDITTLLYKGEFHVKVPERELEFEGTISKYYTSVTDLYKENQVGDFHLELTKKI
ncbi:DUF3219 family protein [Peribacillus cavernae]|uniref:DUF3219 family protein n=1 Tax=Peribacillus cavernae TaxID=1674310 RepID=A0A433HIV4_9BACI|nr:DUF3219 family protein [Peribacillus cavernae]MDQ0220454.1 hypothetical protein [Peribacillus cavernae]RUQ28042.1 DUF3219 family protein [Peribacillus cavernae]